MTLPGEIATELALASDASVHLRVLATSDLHAHLLPFDYYTDRRMPGIGLARLSTLIAAARAAARNSILLDNGDTLQGAPLADAAVAEIVPAGRPHPMFATMNALGFDAGTLGNHDFDFGLEHLEASVAGAEFPIVLSNAHRADGTSFMPTHHILEREVQDANGQTHTLRIGITGAVPPQVAGWNRPLLEGKLQFGDILSAVTDSVTELRAAGADIIIVLAHSGLGAGTEGKGAENVARQLAELPCVHAVVAGHTHRVVPSTAPHTVSSVPIVQPGAFGSHLGCIDLALSPPDPEGGRNSGWIVDRARAGTFAVRGDGPTAPRRFNRLLPDFPEVRSLIAREHVATRSHVDRPLGHTAVPLETYFSTLAPSAATQVVADAQLAAAMPLIAEDPALHGLPVLSAVAPFKAGGRSGPGNYTDVPPGPLKLRHAADLYIYPNLLSVLRIDGRGLRSWLERSASIYHRIDPGIDTPQQLIDHDFAPYNFDQMTGLRYRIDVSQPAATNAEGDQVYETPGRIVDLRFADGRPVTDTDEALVVTNSYRAAGGGHVHAAACAEEVLVGHLTVREAVALHIGEAASALRPVVEPCWSLAPLGGVDVIFETGPGALRHADRLDDLGLRSCRSCAHGLIAHPFEAFHLSL